MLARSVAVLLAIAACGPETTSFRTSDQGDSTDRAGPSAAAYAMRGVDVHVWSNGGYIGSSDEPMTHLGFEIRNSSAHAVVFDSDALALALFDKRGATLPAAAFTAVTPLGPAQVAIAPGTTTQLDVYFRLPVRPRVVETMRVRWVVKIGDDRVMQVTRFVRDDEYPVTDPPESVTPVL
jgi:hypothetical protein